ncbi:conjugative transposon protein TraM [Chitinophaga sp. Ak27]|uniref:conjugative transposon protein TraM n=1 Tax=Chitinophaga sp. Ak27 TaxID=2726116 RepID=UPI00145F3A69|nr:conjugative transposon protein TraM [Chitinophaga sp. Ak27]NLU94842.1 conjugative transposon protein TraM [Chitinophaga sp. Ak27]
MKSNDPQKQRNVSDPQKQTRLFQSLMVLPLFAIPFLALMFWALGGGKKKDELVEVQQSVKVNPSLPDAKFERVKPQNKMSFYDLATQDSLKRSSQSQQDPYLGQPAGYSPAPGTDLNYNLNNPAGLNRSIYNGQHYDPQEARIYDKLNQLNAVINQPPASVSPPPGYLPEASSTPSVNKADLDRLEQMMNTIQSGSGQADPEMSQINALLEKALDIQYPERALEKLNKAKDARKGQVYAVGSAQEDNPITLISTPAKGKQKKASGFFGLDEFQSSEDNNSIAAQVHDNQTIVSGSIVKLRLLNDILIRGELIPKDVFIFGVANINGERLNIEISNIRYHNSIYPVKLSVYDLDGLDGIHIPGAISRDIAKESGSDMISGIGLNSFDPSLATQAASAGIEMSKSLIRRKVKLVKVTLKAGYKLLLKSDAQAASN